MFELEILDLLNLHKKALTKYDQKKIETSLLKLIKQNSLEYERFKTKPDLEIWTRNIFSELDQKINEESTKHKNNNDFEIIKEGFSKWQEEYETNGKSINKNCEKIINKLIEIYLPEKISILKEILKIKDTENFENFKIMLENYIRDYYAIKIEKYYLTNKKNWSFLEKHKKESQILKLLNKIGDYKFDNVEIEEVLN